MMRTIVLMIILVGLAGCSRSAPGQKTFAFPEGGAGPAGSIPKDRRLRSGIEPSLPPATGLAPGLGRGGTR